MLRRRFRCAMSWARVNAVDGYACSIAGENRSNSSMIASAQASLRCREEIRSWFSYRFQNQNGGAARSKGTIISPRSVARPMPCRYPPHSQCLRKNAFSSSTDFGLLNTERGVPVVPLVFPMEFHGLGLPAFGYSLSRFSSRVSLLMIGNCCSISTDRATGKRFGIRL